MTVPPGAKPRSTIMIIQNSARSINAGPVFLQVAGSNSGTESTARTIIPYACKVRRLYVIVTEGTTTVHAFTIRKNGVDTAITVSGTAGATALVSDLVNEATFAAGDYLTLSCARTSGANSATLITATVETEAL